MEQLLHLFPQIEATKNELEKQNRFLHKVTLTGKINALDVAATLFEFTDKMVLLFDDLKKDLIAALVEKNIDTIVQELEFKAQTSIDILIRNLFERTADVGFLATDSAILDFLRGDSVTEAEIQKRLAAYVANYSVYNEVVIFDTQGRVRAHLNPDNTITDSKDPLLQEAMASDGYVAAFCKSDIFPAQKKSLLYAQKIIADGEIVGVLVLCFKFEDELAMIFSSLATEQERLYLCNKEEVIYGSDTRTEHCSYSDEPYRVTKKREVLVSRKTKGYQGYMGMPEWYSVALSRVKESQTQALDPNLQIDILDKNLHEIIDRANELVEDISDVIINGELIASKRRVYLLGPILENMRDISRALLVSIEESVKNLESTALLALTNNAKKSAHLAIDIMDRNLYERANDCRWWALTPLFIEELSKGEACNKALLNETLLSINELYTVYSNIIIFDTTQTIIAASHDQRVIGEKLEQEFIEKALYNRNPKNYFVSNFEQTPLYDEQPTYIYAATILGSHGALGGIAVVFDAQKEFLAMLQESFIEDQKGFMLFVDKERRVIASSSDAIAPLEKLELESKYFEHNRAHAQHDFIEFRGKNYMVAVAASHGYREYKREDNYKNEIFGVTFLEI